MTVKTYQLIASNGNPIRKATMVILSDGRQIKFMERMSRREVLTNLENQLAMAIRYNTPDQALLTQAVEEYVNGTPFQAVSA